MAISSEDLERKLLAAAKGDREALVSLGVTYFEHRRMPTDMLAAKELLRKAANEGDAEAQSSLGNLHFSVNSESCG